MITVLGATGYTGRLCAAEVARLGLPLRVAGRRRDALEALAAELGGVAELRVVDVADEQSLRWLAGDGEVLVSTVGPYERLGRPVLDAALEAGAHYVDVTGEVGFLEWAYGRDGPARGRGVTAVPGAGFDGVPGELLALLAADRLGRPPTAVRVGYLVRGGRPSPGTVQTMLGVVGGPGTTTERWTVPFPEPLGPRDAVSAPLPEQVAVPRSLPGSRASAYFAVPAAPLTQALTRPVGALARAASGTPVWRWLDRAVDRFVRGPDPETRRRTRAAVLAEVRAGDASAAAWGRLTDVYGSTARMAVAVAARLLRGEAPAGVLTPGQLLAEAPAAFLEEVGVVWEAL